MSMFLSYVSLVLALSCIYCTTSFGEIKMFITDNFFQRADFDVNFPANSYRSSSALPRLA